MAGHPVEHFTVPNHGLPKLRGAGLNHPLIRRTHDSARLTPFESLIVTSFTSLGFAEPILRALKQEGYETPTPIQTKAIPVLMSGADLLGIAQTGTGKTAAFALPILEKMLADKRRPAPRTARALILAPTRELAAQIGDSFKAYGRFAKISVAVVVGGVGYTPQTRALQQGLDVLVATPGRLIDHIDSGNIRLDATEFVVLDEADHMLDLGFVVPIRKIISKLPHKRQSMFFSATMPKEIAKLAGEFLHNPQEVAVAPVSTTAERVEQQVFLCDGAAKRGLLVELLEKPEFERTIVFTRTKRGADRVSKTLDQTGIPSAAIHGNKSQNQRQRALDDFKAGKIRVLVATDIAARGIDIDNVTHVINFELPEVPEQYVHRIGRTARAGASGKAIAFCDNSERGLLRDIERLTRQQIPSVDRRGEKGAEVPTGLEMRSYEMRPPRGGRPEQGRGKPRGGNRTDDRGERRDARPQREPRKAMEDRTPQELRGPRPVAGTEPVRQPVRDDRREPRRDERRDGGFRDDRGPRREDRPHRARQGGEGRSEGRGGPREGGFREDRRPHGERPHGERPHAPRSDDRRSHGERPHGERSHGPRGDGDRFGAKPGKRPFRAGGGFKGPRARREG